MWLGRGGQRELRRGNFFAEIREITSLRSKRTRVCSICRTRGSTAEQHGSVLRDDKKITHVVSRLPTRPLASNLGPPMVLEP